MPFRRVGADDHWTVDDGTGAPVVTVTDDLHARLRPRQLHGRHGGVSAEGCSADLTAPVEVHACPTPGSCSMKCARARR